MDDFARSTGLSSGEPPRRYLWTDAFGVCNFLGLHRATGETRYRDLALQLVDQVHSVLGRHRPDDARTGWISGLSEEEGKHHPTAGGLRIGKSLPERVPGEPYDSQAEWDRDGQYYHYLTRWMHALDRVSRETGDTTYHDWAVELARAAHRGFVYPAGPGRELRMVWKMSIDLSRPLVPSMGAHDPLDGLVTLAGLRAAEPDSDTASTLSEEIGELAAMCQGMQWVTEDALGIGGLLLDADRLWWLLATGRFPPLPESMTAEALLQSLLDQVVASLDAYGRMRTVELPSEFRLPFRDLGLAIGLEAAGRLTGGAAEEGSRGPTLDPWREDLRRFLPLRREIINFWLDAANHGPTWTDHRDINAVMLATALAPNGYLGD